MIKNYSKEELEILECMGYRVENGQIYTRYIVECVRGIEHHIYNVTNKDLRIYKNTDHGGYLATNLI